MIYKVIMLCLSMSLFAVEKPPDWQPSVKTLNAIKRAEIDSGLPIGLGEALAYGESRFTPWAVSHNGKGRGLMQINPDYEVYLANKFFKGGAKNFRWWVASDSASLGCAYLAYLINYFGGSVYLGIIAFNWGPSNLQNIKRASDIPESVDVYARQVLEFLDAGW